MKMCEFSVEKFHSRASKLSSDLTETICTVGMRMTSFKRDRTYTHSQFSLIQLKAQYKMPLAIS